MKKWKQMISGLFVCCILMMFMPMYVSADELVPELDETLLYVEPVEFETTADQIAFFGLGQNGLPQMKESLEIRWIDRIKDLPEYAMDLYNWLWENSDADGIEDALIDVTQGTRFGDKNYGYPVVSLGHITADFTFEKGVSEENLGAVMNGPANEAFNAKLLEAEKEAKEYILAVVGAFGRDNAEWFWSGRSAAIGYEIENYKYETYDAEEGTGIIGGDVTLKYCLQDTFSDGLFDVRAEEYRNPDKIYQTKKELESIMADLVREAGKKYSRKDKLDYLNDWLTEHNCYNTSQDLNNIGVDCRTIVSALNGCTGSKGPICEAYAKAFKVLCDRLNIPCILVSGTANDGEHMWNYVQLNDEKWYAVDVTWNDPTGGNTAAVSGNENDTYFLIGSASTGYNNVKFGDSHIITNVAMVGGPQFINGPLLEEEKYDSTLAEFGFKGASLVLQDNLSIKYKMKIDLFKEAGFTNPYIVFNMNGKTTTVTQYAIDEKDGTYIFDFKNISPDKMNDVIFATAYADHNGTKCFSETREYSVAEYCYNQLQKYKEDKYAEFRTLLVDLLNYGACSQTYTGYHVESLVNNKLTQEQSAWGTNVDPDLKPVTNPSYITITNPTVKWRGAALVLNDTIGMKLNFTVEEGMQIDSLHVEIKMKPEGEAEKVWTIPAEKFIAEDMNKYYIMFRGLHAGQLSETVYLTVKAGDEAVSNTALYSIESYAYSKQSDSDVNLAALVKAMMKYGNAAHAYIN